MNCKRNLAILMLILLICALTVVQADTNNGVIVNGGSVGTINNYVNNFWPVSPRSEGLTNGDLVQIATSDDGYQAYRKQDILGTTSDIPLNSFLPSMVRGWNKDQGYQYILYGRYYQDHIDQPITWRVLGVKDGRALLVSEFILDTRPFDTSSNEWSSSDLHHWLNGAFFYDAFTEEERDAILQNNREGSVFLLSRTELANPSYGFNKDIYSTDRMRSASGTMYAYDNNLWNVKESDFTNYYARSKANSKNVDLVTSSGKIMLARIDRDNVGVRPAIWIELSECPLTNGEGTFSYPFQ